MLRHGGASSPFGAASEPPNVTIREMEKRMIKACLQRNHEKRDATAAELGISLRSLFNKIREYGIEPK